MIREKELSEHHPDFEQNAAQENKNKKNQTRKRRTNMIQIKVGTNTKKETVNAEVTSTPLQLLQAHDVNIAGASVSLNGTPLTTAQYDKTFAELGVADETAAMLIATVKADSARK